MKISSERLNAQIAAVSLRSTPLNDGCEITVNSVQENEVEGSNGKPVFSDNLICSVTGHDDVSTMRIPLREFLKMKDEDGNHLYQQEQDADEASISTKFTIKSSKTRERNGEAVYPIGAYRDAQKLYDGDIDYNECIKGGFGEKTEKDGVTLFNGFPPLRDYVVEAN